MAVPVPNNTTSSSSRASPGFQPATSNRERAFHGQFLNILGTADTAGTTSRKNPSDIIRDYQVAEDKMVQWKPDFGPIPIPIPGIDSRWLTKTEADLLDSLGDRKGLLGLKQFSDTRDDAYNTADKYFPQTDAAGNEIRGGEDGHNDAFRHAYWNALMTKRFGEDFAAAFGTAHEGVPGNEADREAMDLFNNELGRKIASSNPNASDEELAKLVHKAVKDGQAVVINGSNDLVYSDQVSVGKTGKANDLPRAGGKKPPEWTGSL